MINEIEIRNKQGLIKTSIVLGDELYLYFNDVHFDTMVNDKTVEVQPNKISWTDILGTHSFYVDGSDLIYHIGGVYNSKTRYNFDSGMFDITHPNDDNIVNIDDFR